MDFDDSDITPAKPGATATLVGLALALERNTNEIVAMREEHRETRAMLKVAIRPYARKPWEPYVNAASTLVLILILWFLSGNVSAGR